MFQQTKKEEKKMKKKKTKRGKLEDMEGDMRIPREHILRWKDGFQLKRLSSQSSEKNTT